ncbi:hypothetical protein KPL40_05755 [Clostridium gasigenes]|uniref:hypothetical protein n=1 Tax=Clostridium gasigenes TaxID=94869 RepID=UPI001C0CF99B|nr:hypothetical protein [Clostridium gasigenes]MBU3131951.1 hypothetical protein [Clostridium gasigenes]
MLIPKSKIETVELMWEEDSLGEISYDLVVDRYSFKKNEETNDLRLYPAEFYGLFNREVREVPSDVIREFIVDRIIPYNRMNLDCYLEYYNLEYFDEWEVFLASKGMCFLDIFWIRKEKSESYKNHIRFTNSVRNDLLTEEYFINKKFTRHSG